MHYPLCRPLIGFTLSHGMWALLFLLMTSPLCLGRMLAMGAQTCLSLGELLLQSKQCQHSMSPPSYLYHCSDLSSTTDVTSSNHPNILLIPLLLPLSYELFFLSSSPLRLQEVNSMINKRLKDALFTDQWSELCMDTLSRFGYVLVSKELTRNVVPGQSLSQSLWMQLLSISLSRSHLPLYCYR